MSYGNVIQFICLFFFTEKEYLMHFTSTTPFHMRYTLLNTDTEAIKLTVWYSRPNRLDVYVGGNYVIAKNARINHLGFYVIDMPIGNLNYFLHLRDYNNCFSLTGPLYL